MNHAFKNLWLRVLLKTRYGDHRLLNALYLVDNPWDMDSPREEFRFVETNRIIRSQFGRPSRVLEVGCGEGHQSGHLLKICDSLFGIDVSNRAIMRAQTRCSGATFGVGDIFHAEILKDRPPFDLIVACEVLYYMRDIPDVLDRMDQIGSACFITYYEDRSVKLDQYFANFDASHRATFGIDNTRWKAVWWRGASPHHQAI